MNLFIDIDGVVVGKTNPSSHKISLALCAEEFVDFVIEHFNCYWLTTHCKGSASDVWEYLSPYTTKQLNTKLLLIKPTQFNTLKTEALFGNYIWIDDAPLASELQELKRNNNYHRWLKVNTYKRPHDLCRCLRQLQNLSNNGFSIYR